VLSLSSGKVVVITLAIVFAGSFLSRQVATTTDRLVATTTDRFSHLGGAQFWGNLEKQLADAANPSSDLPLAKKEKLLSQIHAVVERWRSFVREASLLFNEPTLAPASK
jgi:hypothetical protein